MDDFKLDKTSNNHYINRVEINSVIKTLKITNPLIYNFGVISKIISTYQDHPSMKQIMYNAVAKLNTQETKRFTFELWLVICACVYIYLFTLSYMNVLIKIEKSKHFIYSVSNVYFISNTYRYIHKNFW